VNPNHLWLGTHTHNMRDMFKKGRREEKRGTDHHMTTMTEDDVRYIRRTKKGPNELAEEFNTTRNTIWRIRTGRTWGHVK
jgi:hypothetical protein